MKHGLRYQLLELLVFARKRSLLAAEITKLQSPRHAWLDPLRLGFSGDIPVYTNIVGFENPATLDKCSSCGRADVERMPDRCKKCFGRLHAECIAKDYKSSFCIPCAEKETTDLELKRLQDKADMAAKEYFASLASLQDAKADAEEFWQETRQVRQDAETSKSEVDRLEKELAALRENLSCGGSAGGWEPHTVYNFSEECEIPLDRQAPNGRLLLKPGDTIRCYVAGSQPSPDNLPRQGQIISIEFAADRETVLS